MSIFAIMLGNAIWWSMLVMQSIGSPDASDSLVVIVDAMCAISWYGVFLRLRESKK